MRAEKNGILRKSSLVTMLNECASALMVITKNNGY
jgi:NCAIR mutase (PurE)-related protein